MFHYPNLEQFYKDNYIKLLDWKSPLRPSKSCPKNGAVGVAKFKDFYQETGSRYFTEDEVLSILDAEDVEDGDTIFHQNLRVMRELNFVISHASGSKQYEFTDEFISFVKSQHTVDCCIIEKLMSISCVEDLTMYFNFLICVMREAAIYGQVIQYRDSAAKFTEDVPDKQKRMEHQSRIFNVYGFKGDEARIVPENYTPNISYFCHAVLRQLGILRKSDVKIDNMGTLVLTPLGEMILKKIDENLSQNVLIEKHINKVSSNYNGEITPKIFYGAPGTGKSFGADGEIHKIYPEGSEEEKKYVIRTTFHPDSDYSTFVGCYKPTKVVPMRDRYTIAELKLLYQEFKKTCDARPEIQFAGRYFTSIEPLSKDERMLVFVGSEENVVKSEVPKAIYAARAYAETCEKSSASITYAFTPQAFTKAYIAAWESVLKGEGKDVFLVIEEINRGNCAQIFGDLFQLLDRKENGRSRYPIKPDTDLGNYINEQLGKLVDDEHEDKAIARGEEMVLPENLYIWATMNTSDQSLFPIDSAFKRRWDWKYVPICKGRDRDGNELNWRISADTNEYDWWSFIGKINERIDSVTHSEDKKLGFFFCKADDNVISCENFVGKVIFYLWNDVFKDRYSEDDIFKDSDGSELSFSKFFYVDHMGDTYVEKEKIEVLLNKMGVKVVGEVEEEDEDGNTSISNPRDYTKYSVNGGKSVGKNKLAVECVSEYIKMNPDMLASEVVVNWKDLGNFVPHFIETEDEFNQRQDKDKSNRSTQIACKGSSVYVACNGYSGLGKVSQLINAIQKANWNISIEKKGS